MKNAHYCILVNRKASRYQKKPIERLTEAIRKKGDRYTVLEPSSAMELFTTAGKMAAYRKDTKSAPPEIRRWGKITSLIACGGDGTFNLVARAALSKNMPMGIIPMGRFNNIARFLYETPDSETAIAKIMEGHYRTMDCGKVGDQMFFGSVGLGFIPRLAELLAEHKTPRFAIGWAKLASKASEAVKAKKTVLKIDSFRFEVMPTMLNINLLPYSVGLPLSSASLADDQHLEVIFDREDTDEELSHYVRLIHKGKYYYGETIGLYRGEVITIQPTHGRTLYLDGELLKLPSQSLEVTVSEKKVKVFC